MSTSFLVLLFFCVVFEISSTSTSNDGKEEVCSTENEKNSMFLTNYLLEKLNNKERQDAIINLKNDYKKLNKDISEYLFPSDITAIMSQEIILQKFFYIYLANMNRKPDPPNDYISINNATIKSEYKKRQNLLKDIYEDENIEQKLSKLIEPKLTEDDNP
ncbi:uncharacterized protein LOC126896736 isoform X1 [Daktulosphaira vitifoliae]|uniref:uncharacterized protein LOC126896736 isoform X1 n=1 Tax=Daktulosphaira vitifoliae TaxID=58002 RepID=UPI0021AA2D5A|nr:uncharacterized protein LOC126896736 isoform X1 [Daktulosphaira vitifoliae]